jgi:hypothetical protein
MLPLTKHLCRALLVGVLLFIPVSTGSAALVAKPPCWRTLLYGWYQTGKIPLTYPASCYRQVIKHLPPPVQAYSAALQDFETAFVEVSQRTPGSTSTSIGPSSAPESFPVALVALGAAAIALVVAGLAGVLWQRRHPNDDSET